MQTTSRHIPEPPPQNVLPVDAEQVQNARFLVSPRLLDQVRDAAPLALIGHGALTALSERALDWAPERQPTPALPAFLHDLLPGQMLGLDVVYGGWASTEAAVVVPADQADPEAVAERLERRWYWTVDAEGGLSAVDRVAGVRHALGPFDQRSGPSVFLDLEGPLDDHLPRFRAPGTPEPLDPATVFVRGGTGDAMEMSTWSLVRIPDPTPDAGRWLTARRIEALVDLAKRVVGDIPVVELVLGPKARLYVLANRAVVPQVGGAEVSLTARRTLAPATEDGWPVWGFQAPVHLQN